MSPSISQSSDLAIRSRPLEPNAHNNLFDEATELKASIRKLQVELTEAMTQSREYGPAVAPRGEHAPIEVNNLRKFCPHDRNAALSELETATRNLTPAPRDEEVQRFKDGVEKIQQLVYQAGSGYEASIPCNFVEQATASEQSLVERTRAAIFQFALSSKGLSTQVQADDKAVQYWADAHYAQSQASRNALLPGRPLSEIQVEMESTEATLAKTWKALVESVEATSVCTGEEMQNHWQKLDQEGGND